MVAKVPPPVPPHKPAKANPWGNAAKNISLALRGGKPLPPKRSTPIPPHKGKF